MDKLSYLLETSIYFTILFLIIIIIKNIFKDRISPTMHFMIWFIPIARLCIPFTIESDIRLIVIREKTVNSFQMYDKISSNQPSAWKDDLLFIWLGGILVLSIRMLVNMVRMKKEIKIYGIEPLPYIEEILSLSCKELAIRRKIKTIMLPNVMTPALTIGLVPKVIIPTDICERINKNQLELVIKHELMHYKRRDYMIVLLLRIIEIVYWFNPVVWLMCWQFSQDIEVACDSMVVRNLDKQQKKNYALSFVQLASQKRRSLPVLNLIFDKDEKIVEKRIRRIFINCKRRPSVIIAIATMVTTMFIGGFTTILQPLIQPVDNSENIYNYKIIYADGGLSYCISAKSVTIDSYNKSKSTDDNVYSSSYESTTDVSINPEIRVIVTSRQGSNIVDKSIRLEKDPNSSD